MQGFLHNIGEMLHFPTIFYDRMRPPLRQMVFNLRNHLTWQFENPHAIRESAFQYRWAINVWAGVLKDRVINILVNYKENIFSFIVFSNVFIIGNFF